MELVTLSEQEYDEFARSHPYANFLNSMYSGRKFEKKNWSCDYLGLQDASGLHAAALLVSTPLRKFRYFYVPRGYLMDYQDTSLLQEFTEKLTVFMKERNGLYMKMDPYVAYLQRDCNGDVVEGGFDHSAIVQSLTALGYQHQGFTVGYDEASQCRWMSVLDLRGKTAEQLLKAMNSQTRQNIKNTIKNNIKVRTLAYDELHILDEIVDVTSERRGFSNLSLSYYQEEYELFQEHAAAYYAYLDLDDYEQRIQDELKQEQDIIESAQAVLLENPHSKNSKTRLATAQQHIEALKKRALDAQELIQEHGHELPLAASMFILYGNEVVYLTSGSYDQYKRFKGPYALQWYMIQLALAQGYSFYNFYGISGYFDKEADGYGVFDFKRGFQAEVVELIGDVILPVQPKKYATYQRLQKLKQKLKR